MPPATASQVELLREAEGLANELISDPRVTVAGNVFRSLIADFLAQPDTDRLRRLLGLAVESRFGHCKRAGGFGDQLQRVCNVLPGYLATTNLGPEELKSVFGWTARLLSRSPGQGGRGSKSGTAGSLAGETTGRGEAAKPAARVASTPIRAVKGKGMADLSALKSRLEQREKTERK